MKHQSEPLPPRLLTAAQAAAYFQLPKRRFEALRIGRVSFGAKVLYDRIALDRYLDELAGLDPPVSAVDAADTAEAALERFRAHSAGAARRP